MRWLGISATKDDVLYVDVEVPTNDDDPLIVLADGNWKVQKGDRSAAYDVLHQQCADYVRENEINKVFVKASAVAGKGAAKLGMLHAAEVRGIAIAAAASAAQTIQVSKATISRTYGDRNVDDYVEDNAFWAEQTTGGSLRKMSRTVAMLLVAARAS